MNNDNSVVGVVIIPLICGVFGLLLFGPVGFFVGGGLALVIGANMDLPESEKDKRIAELEQRVRELESESDS